MIAKKNLFFALIFVSCALLGTYYVLSSVDDVKEKKEKKAKKEKKEAPDFKPFPRNVSRNVIDYVPPFLNTTLMQPSTLCQEANSTFLVIFVHSAVFNFDKRRIIRETWGNTTLFDYPMFNKMHESLEGKYLEPNIGDWKNYSDSSHQPLRTSKIRTRVVFIIGVDSEQSQDHHHQLTQERYENGNITKSFVYFKKSFRNPKHESSVS